MAAGSARRAVSRRSASTATHVVTLHSYAVVCHSSSLVGLAAQQQTSRAAGGSTEWLAALRRRSQRSAPRTDSDDDDQCRASLNSASDGNGSDTKTMSQCACGTTQGNHALTEALKMKKTKTEKKEQKARTSQRRGRTDFSLPILCEARLRSAWTVAVQIKHS